MFLRLILGGYLLYVMWFYVSEHKNFRLRISCAIIGDP
ncbi:hypothetical protein EPIB1_1883 [Tritonibacter mobilis]|nr:hypothetical protein EPIB1_1883 [Tritonibacter mobilis]